MTKNTAMISPRSGQSQATGVIKGAKAKYPLVLYDDGSLIEIELPLRDPSVLTGASYRAK